MISLSHCTVACSASLPSCLFQNVSFFQTHYNDWPVAASHSAAGQEKMSLFEVPSLEWQHRSLLLCLVSNLEPALKPYKEIALIIAQQPVHTLLFFKKLKSNMNWQGHPLINITDPRGQTRMIHPCYFSSSAHSCNVCSCQCFMLSDQIYVTVHNTAFIKYVLASLNVHIFFRLFQI